MDIQWRMKVVGDEPRNGRLQTANGEAKGNHVDKLTNIIAVLLIKNYGTKREFEASDCRQQLQIGATER
jgi:hypothetical protein